MFQNLDFYEEQESNSINKQNTAANFYNRIMNVKPRDPSCYETFHRNYLVEHFGLLLISPKKASWKSLLGKVLT